MKYEYSFFLHHFKNRDWSASAKSLFRMLEWRLAVDMTEDEFALFRYELLRDGIELMEITRVPYHVPETVL